MPLKFDMSTTLGDHMTRVSKGMLVAARDFRWSGSDGPMVFFARGLRRVLAKMAGGRCSVASPDIA